MSIKSILLVSAYFPPSVGGPATFVSGIGKEFEKKGYGVAYANLEPYKKLSKLRRTFLFLRDVWQLSAISDVVLIADTWSVLIPTAFICILKRKKYSVRIGGDFLWEKYVARTKESVKLSVFYTKSRQLSCREKVISFLIKMTLSRAEIIIFNTEWQRKIWQKPYSLEKLKTGVVQNALVTGEILYAWNSSMPKIIRCPVRASDVKNVAILKKIWDGLSKECNEVELSFEYIHPDERKKILSETYAIIQPSVSDVAPNLICESVASGCPFICTEDTGIQDLISATVGLYVDTENESKIQKAIENILDPNVHSKLVKNIKDLNLHRTYEVLAEEYQYIWKKMF